MLKYIIEGIGIIGMGVVLVNLYLLETGHEKAKSRKYLCFGLIGSIILVGYSFLTRSHLFVLLNLVFVFVNAYWLITLHKRKTKFKKKSKKKKKR